jgi:hypothetical protein
MGFKPHERLLPAACLCGALACAAIASSRDFNPLGASIPDGKLALVRGSNRTATEPTYCDELVINKGGPPAVGGHRGCINKPVGTICIMCAVTANRPTNVKGIGPFITDATVNCNIGQNDKMLGSCDGNVSCINLKMLNANCVNTIGGNVPE